MNSVERQPITEERPWFYEKDGERKGAVSESDMIDLINQQNLSYGALVWKSGFPEWMKVENTELRIYLDKVAPPPLTGAHVSNKVVWVLAFAPIIGFLLESFIAGVTSDNESVMNKAIGDGKFWYVALFLNIALSIWDLNILKKSGTDTTVFGRWVMLIPVYLYQRSKALKQNLAYFIVWIICFIYSLVTMAQF